MNPAGGNQYLLCILDGDIRFWEGGWQPAAGVTVNDGAWHHIVATRENMYVKIYVDGVYMSAGSYTSGVGFGPGDRWSIAQEWDGETPSDFYTGAVDDVRLYNRALADAQVLDLFNGIAPIFLEASFPNPSNEAENVTATLLEWVAGDTAVSHDVYFGTNKNEVAAGTGEASKGNQAEVSFDPGPLLLATTYYWRIDEKASDGTITAGEVWSFTTAEFAVVDGFEGYNNYTPDEIWNTWKDGFDVPTNGAQAGYDDAVVQAGGNYVEMAIVHGGNQSMPFFYDNSTASFSEAVRTFTSPRDFILNGLTGLTLWFQGQPAAVGSVSFDPASQIYTLNGSGTDIGGTSDEFHYAFKQLTGAGSITVKVESLTDTHSWARAGVMIRDTLDAGSPHAMVVVTPNGRVAFGFRELASQESYSTHTATGTITGPHWVRLTRSGIDLFKAEHSADGVNWAPVESGNPQDPSGWNISMGQTVHVGLLVSAHDATEVGEATFSNLSITGNVLPGPITESADVGIGSNSPDPLYLRLEDNAGNFGTVYHPDGPDAVLVEDWDLWAIPLEDFQNQGVDLASVIKIAIGVGDKDNPQPGGPGRLFIDDIHLVRRLPATGRVILLEEDFESLALGPNVDEGVAGDEVWTKIPPYGWTIDDAGVPGAGDPANDGVTEWAGWSFANKEWWAETAEDQERSQFALANGTVALVDGDEWDDQDHAPGLLNSFLSTPEIDVSTTKAGPGTIQLKFDSSWRRYAKQTANVTVQFDGGDPIEVLRYESEGADTGFVKDDAVSEAVTVDIDRPAAAKKMVVTFGMTETGDDWWWAIDNIEVSALPRERAVVFSEDFEGLPLGPNVDETVVGDEVWTKTAPEGWTVDDSGVPGLDNPADGVAEWAGWTFADNDWWASVDDQRRSEFELAVGAAAIADSDEYDDKGDPVGTYNAFMSTPSIDISDLETGTVELTFDSSWRPESSQTANVTASYDGGDPIEVMRWESSSDSSFFHDHNTNETVAVPLANPEGAQTVVLTFGYFDADNNWWWAIDNVVVSGFPKAAAAPIRIFSEKFDGVTLTPSVDEVPPGDFWTKTPPAGWNIDDSRMAGFGDPATDGVTDWAGWSFANKDWWAQVAGDQERSTFDLGTGTIAICDPDEWDDAFHSEGTFNSFLDTAPLDISGVDAGTVELKFDSSWRPYAAQTATVSVSFDGGDWIDVLVYESDSASANFKDHTTSETVTVPLNNPAGASSVIISFGLFNAGNDWWWAIDNLEVSGLSGGNAVALLVEDFETLPLGPSPEEAPPGNFWTDVPPEGWIVDDSGVPGAGDPANDGVTEWAGWSFVRKDWWAQVAGDQERSLFEQGNAVVAVVDGDEWDDMPHAEGEMSTFLSTPAIDVSGMQADTLKLKFDSSWRQWDMQTASVTVQFDGAAPIEVMRWESSGGDPALLKPDATDEAVTVDLNNPAGAAEMIITFGVLNAGDDWWWAIDNVEVIGFAGP